MKNVSSEILEKNLPIRMRSDTYDFLHQEAVKRDRSKAWLIRRILETVQEEPKRLPELIRE